MTYKHARYLVNPDTQHVELVVADQVDDKKSNGWVDPTGLRANGYVFNRPEDQGTTDAAGESLAAHNAYKADKAKAKADEANALTDEAKAKEDAAKDEGAKAAAPKPESYFGRVVDAIEGKSP